jgi:hypothetical protein
MAASRDRTWDATSIQSSFFLSLVPADERIIPNHNITWDGWVIANASLFNTQWINCSYPISGGYGQTPRYLFYALIFFAVVARRKSWIAGVALASVMTYSSIAAIHAFALAVDRTQMVSQFSSNSYEVVMVGGNTTDGMWVGSTWNNWRQDGLWLPVLPMVWDSDVDAVLAIVGVSFLVIAPMQAWSSTFNKSEAKAVLLLWSFLLFIGMVCALIAEEYIWVVGFPQLRFCPFNSNDTLPITNSASEGPTISWNPNDIYQANRTLAQYFANSTTGLATSCVYPCFGYVSSLRDPADIVAQPPGLVSSSASNVKWTFYVTVYFLICSSGISSLAIFFMQRSTRIWTISKTYQNFQQKWKLARDSHLSLELATLLKILVMLWYFWLHLLNIYARALSPISVLILAAFAEWNLWEDLNGESFRHIGQWGSLVAVGLVFTAALVDHYGSKAKKLKKWLHWKSHSKQSYSLVDRRQGDNTSYLCGDTIRS